MVEATKLSGPIIFDFLFDVLFLSSFFWFDCTFCRLIEGLFCLWGPYICKNWFNNNCFNPCIESSKFWLFSGFWTFWFTCSLFCTLFNPWFIIWILFWLLLRICSIFCGLDWWYFLAIFPNNEAMSLFLSIILYCALCSESTLFFYINIHIWRNRIILFRKSIWINFVFFIYIMWFFIIKWWRIIIRGWNINIIIWIINIILRRKKGNTWRNSNFNRSFKVRQLTTEICFYRFLLKRTSIISNWIIVLKHKSN